MRRRLPFLVLLLAIGCGGGAELELVQPRVGVIEESFLEPARTRLAHTYPITQPLDGRLGRIALEPGDTVTAGQELATFDRVPWEERATEARAMVAELEAAIALNDYHELENLAMTEVTTTIEAAAKTLEASRAQVEARRAHAERARVQLERNSQLLEGQAVSQSELDDSQLAADTSMIDLRSEEFSLSAHELFFTIIQLGPKYVEKWLHRKTLQKGELVERLAQARSRQVVAEHDLALARIVSPIDGIVLEKYEQGDARLPAGTPLVLLGNPAELEVVVDVLTEEALRLAPGTNVTLESLAFPAPVACRVQRIEPAGFTKLSSLGIEQQRVRGIVGFDTIPPGLGVGYRVHARFLTGRREDALIVPRSAVLQGADGTLHVFEVVDQHLVRRTVELGLRSDLEVEVLSGLARDATLLAAPDATMREGDAVGE